MAQYYGAPPNQAYGPSSAQNLQFYNSSYNQPVSGHATPSQASYGYGGPSAAGFGGAPSGFNSGFGVSPGVSGRMGEQGGLRTGWLAAFSTEGYDGEPPLLEELGINFDHIKAKVRYSEAGCCVVQGGNYAGYTLVFVVEEPFPLPPLDVSIVSRLVFVPRKTYN